MKSKFFTDTQGLESAFESCAPDKVSVCLRLSRHAYDAALQESARLGLTSGEYIESLILARQSRSQRPLTCAGTKAPLCTNIPPQRPQPAPPAR